MYLLIIIINVFINNSVESSPIEIKKELQPLLGKCSFVSATYRIFKPPTNPTNKKKSVMYNGELI